MYKIKQNNIHAQVPILKYILIVVWISLKNEIFLKKKNQKYPVHLFFLIKIDVLVNLPNKWASGLKFWQRLMEN